MNKPSESKVVYVDSLTVTDLLRPGNTATETEWPVELSARSRRAVCALGASDPPAC
jgi:hypothetical protein